MNATIDKLKIMVVSVNQLVVSLRKMAIFYGNCESSVESEFVTVTYSMIKYWKHSTYSSYNLQLYLIFYLLLFIVTFHHVFQLLKVEIHDEKSTYTTVILNVVTEDYLKTI